MKTVKVASMLVRGSGILLIVLGVLMWLGIAYPVLKPIHMVLGFVLVFALWALSIVAAGSHLYALAGAGIVWGLVVSGLGSAQVKIMPGESHWIIQLVHLLVGLAAMGLAETIAKRIRIRRGSEAQV